jgi:O-antigen/teichoic acid export membrane protein
LRGKGLKGQLMRGVIGSAGLKAVNAMLSLAVAIVLARTLGPAGYGTYAFAFSLVSLLAVPAQLGLPSLLVRDIAKYHYLREWGLLRGLLRRATQIVIGVSLALMAGGTVAAWLLSPDLDSEKVKTFLWALALIPLIAFGNIRGAALRGLRRVVQGQLPEQAIRPGLYLALLGAGAWFGAMTAEGAMALRVVAATGAFVVGVVLLRRHVPPEAVAADPAFETRAWLRAILPLSLIAGMGVINRQTDIVILGLFTTSADVGIYRTATQGAELVVFLLSAVTNVIAPYVSRLYTGGEMERLQRLATTSARVILLLAFPVAGAFIFFGEEILSMVFGKEYAPGQTPLAILCVGQLFSAAAGSVGMLLNMAGYERDTARGFAVATAFNVILNIILIPPLGMTGAAIATAASLVIWNSLLCRQVWVRMGIQSTAIRFRYRKK